jgi:hypothetical protein
MATLISLSSAPPRTSSSLITPLTVTYLGTTSSSLHRPHIPYIRSPSSLLHPQTTSRRPATFIRRPKRPYTFTQLVTLSDGSTYLHRTSSPTPIHRSTKDQRNTPLWNPSSTRLRTVEADSAGRLRAFRARFGRGWDAVQGTAKEVAKEAEEGENEGLRVLRGEDGEGTESGAVMEGGEVEGKHKGAQVDREESLLDLIAGFERDETVERGMQSKKKERGPAASGKKKK